MRSCDTCPGGEECSGHNIHPVLVKVHDLYATGRTDKMDILFALTDEDEALLEAHIVQVSRSCWTKAALLAIADVLARDVCANGADADTPARIEAALKKARAAFARFPWHLPDLVDQAPDLLEAITERSRCADLAEHLSKRQFLKICKTVAFDDEPV